MKSLMLAALLLLAASGWADARGSSAAAAWTQYEDPQVSVASAPGSEPGLEPGNEQSTEPVADTSTESVADTSTEPVADTSTESVADTSTEPVADTNTEPVADTSTEPVADTSTEVPGVAGMGPAPVDTEDSAQVDEDSRYGGEQDASSWTDFSEPTEMDREAVAELDAAGSGPIQPGEEGAPATPADSLMMDVGEVLDELLWPEPYLYQSTGTRDPFSPLVGEQDAWSEGPIAIGDIVVVGVLWSESDRFALIETRGGKNLVLRAGDRVQDGRVIEVLPDGLRISHTLYGITRVVTLPVRSGLEGKDER